MELNQVKKRPGFTVRRSSAWLMAPDSEKFFSLSESIIRFSSIIIVSKWGIIGIWGRVIFCCVWQFSELQDSFYCYITPFSLLNTSTFPLPGFPQQNAPADLKCLTEGRGIASQQKHWMDYNNTTSSREVQIRTFSWQFRVNKESSKQRGS